VNKSDKNPWGLKLGPRVGGCLEARIVDRERNLPELKILGSDMIEVRGVFLLDLVFEDADVFAFWELHSKHLILSITDNEAVE